MSIRNFGRLVDQHLQSTRLRLTPAPMVDSDTNKISRWRMMSSTGDKLLFKVEEDWCSLMVGCLCCFPIMSMNTNPSISARLQGNLRLFIGVEDLQAATFLSIYFTFPKCFVYVEHKMTQRCLECCFICLLSLGWKSRSQVLQYPIPPIFM
ncbi:hypothetical protein Ancab_037769 [Ancistrocladus abbreviatus]